MSTTNRRKFLGRGVAAAAAVTAVAAPAEAQEAPKKKVLYRNGKKPEKTPLFNCAVAYGNLLFICGKGYHSEGDIKVHTKDVLRQIKEELERAGSSMEKVEVQCVPERPQGLRRHERDLSGRLRTGRAASSHHAAAAARIPALRWLKST